MSGSGWETLPDVREMWEALPDVRMRLGGPSGCPGVGRDALPDVGNVREAHLDVRQWSEALSDVWVY